MRRLLEKMLQSEAKAVLAAHHPTIVAVTGSYGKTATKDAIFTVLQDGEKVRHNIKSYNNELGVPLTIVGKEAPGSSLSKWFSVLKAARRALNDYGYPETLILEMAADHPGDLKKLTSLARPKISVVTAVGPVHLQYFLTVDNVAKEKSMLVEVLPEGGTAVLNGDDPNVSAMSKKTKAQVLTYGFSGDVDVQAVNVQRVNSGGAGFSFKIRYNGGTFPVVTKNLLAEYQIYSLLAAFTVGMVMGKKPLEVAKRLADFELPPGRLKLLGGIKHATLVDDTYNASPVTVKGAITVLRQAFPQSRTWAVLGDMLELGGETVQAHEEIGRHVAKTGIEYLVVVGERSKDTARAAKETGMSEDKIFRFERPEEAGKFLEDEIQKGDVLLMKGSQGARMEKIVKELMARPEDAPILLVRQGKGWE